MLLQESFAFNNVHPTKFFRDYDVDESTAVFLRYESINGLIYLTMHYTNIRHLYAKIHGESNLGAEPKSTYMHFKFAGVDSLEETNARVRGQVLGYFVEDRHLVFDERRKAYYCEEQPFLNTIESVKVKDLSSRYKIWIYFTFGTCTFEFEELFAFVEEIN
jgi:hypothetical protein